MQRLSPQGDDGAVAAFVAVLCVVLFGAGALAIDVGAMYAERRQLQNGADAAALAIALGCAKDQISCQVASVNVAAQYANANANDGETNVGRPLIDSAAGTVTIDTSTLNDGSRALPPVFGRVLQGNEYDGVTVRATATARWGGPIHQLASPLGISSCAFLAGGGYNVMPVVGEGTLIHDEPEACGFGWLNDSPCTDEVDWNVNQAVDVGTVPEEDECRTLLRELVNQGKRGVPVVVPVYDASGESDTAVAGFAAFVLTGYQLRDHDPPGQWKSAPPAKCLLPTASCIQGHFVFTSTDAGEFGGPADYGVAIVRLID